MKYRQFFVLKLRNFHRRAVRAKGHVLSWTIRVCGYKEASVQSFKSTSESLKHSLICPAGTRCGQGSGLRGLFSVLEGRAKQSTPAHLCGPFGQRHTTTRLKTAAAQPPSESGPHAPVPADCSPPQLPSSSSANPDRHVIHWLGSDQ